jgi:glycosyltransferase involved in cell wall biosynthesis
MPEEAYVARPRPLRLDKRTWTLVYVGTLNQLYKAPDVLIDAVALCVLDGLDLELVMVGGGQYLPNMQARAAARGLGERTRFCGSLSAGDAIREQMDQADILVLPSRQEALGQVIVEAMARGLPCIGSTTGSTPEMLPPEYLVPPNDANALALKIREVVTDPLRMARASARNLDKAQEYRELLVNKRRDAFYRRVKEATQAWLKGKHN